MRDCKHRYERGCWQRELVCLDCGESKAFTRGSITSASERDRLRQINAELLAALKRLLSDHKDGLTFDIVWADAETAIRHAEES